MRTIHTVHFVGIKGIAMSALAVWAHEKGFNVTGSDIEEKFPSDPILKKIGVNIFNGFHRNHIRHPDLVVYTGAHGGRDNIEVKEAQNKEIPVLPHGRALGLVMQGKMQLSVAGSHGKTTTSAMIATILMNAGMDPSYAVGCGEIRGLGLPGHYGKGEYFVAEADEYVTDPNHDQTPRFLWQRPDILVITNVDYDHPDVYASLEGVQRAFVDLMNQQEGKKLAIVNIEDPATDRLISTISASRIITYGLSDMAKYRGKHIVFHAGKTTFELEYNGGSLGIFTIKVPGRHNVLNAIAAGLASHECGATWEAIRTGLAKFEGAKRRFELIGQQNQISYYDDYAHHPREITATLAAVRSWYPHHRIIVVFQPHTYSRTKSLLSDFGVSFTHSDIVIPCEIYGSARETDTLGMSGKLFADEIRKHHPRVLFARRKEDVITVLGKTVKKGDKVIFMGAGDIYSWERQVVKQLKNL